MSLRFVLEFQLQRDIFENIVIFSPSIQILCLLLLVNCQVDAALYSENWNKVVPIVEIKQLRFTLLSSPKMGFHSLMLLAFIANVLSRESVLLCRNCGYTIVSSSVLKDVRSPLAMEYYNMSILGKERLVQVLENPVPKLFNVITAETADLALVGRPYSAETWFPKHEWTACVCPRCRAHMGWYFQSGNIQSKSTKSFVGLVLDYLISADFVDSLIHAV